MDAPIEVRSEIRIEGGEGPAVLTGVILTYGDEAIITREGRRERFAARSCFLAPSISLNIQHDRGRVLVDSLGASLADKRRSRRASRSSRATGYGVGPRGGVGCARREVARILGRV